MSDEFVQFERQGTTGIITVSGEVDLSNSPQLRKTILGSLHIDSHLKINLAHVTYIDSSGIAALVEGLQTANKDNKQFTLVSPSSQVKSILELARLDMVFNID